MKKSPANTQDFGGCQIYIFCHFLFLIFICNLRLLCFQLTGGRTSLILDSGSYRINFKSCVSLVTKDKGFPNMRGRVENSALLVFMPVLSCFAMFLVQICRGVFSQLIGKGTLYSLYFIAIHHHYLGKKKLELDFQLRKKKKQRKRCAAIIYMFASKLTNPV